jgi:NADH:ubiquinone oxidoreductase subunit F (NADH-binding)/NADH:ubiquinone oxidoreductase subunit E/Pyruvate/2-oxoacid:ferredoxin oxidoreductase delta subunit
MSEFRINNYKLWQDLNKDVDQILANTGTSQRNVIPILHEIQKKYNYLPEAALRRVCESTEISPATIYGVSTFYNQFRHSPVGKHMIHICTGTACHVKGSDLVIDAFYRELSFPEGTDTDDKGEFTVQKVACLGCCTLAPVIQIDGITYGHVTPNGVDQILHNFLSNNQNKPSKHLAQQSSKDTIGEVRIGLGSCCVASGSADVHQALQESIRDTGIHTSVKRVGCVGMCHRVPLLEIIKPGEETILYDKVAPHEVKKIMRRHFKATGFGQKIKNSLYDFADSLIDNETWQENSHQSLHTRDPQITVFLERQQHIATEYAGVIDPLDIGEYQEGGGFQALNSCIKDSDPQEIISIIIASGLRGRGGAGFHTGMKWQLAHDAKDEHKYIICNGDEGDPGAFMDRMIMESYPFRVIEGMIIAALTAGAGEGFLYIRAEYQLAVQRMQNALDVCYKKGLLGQNILGSDFSLDLKIMQGAGAFVCGEETALIASIEGKRGMPNFRPPYPVENGLWGHSTLVNNCETFATISWIIRNGPKRFATLGTEKSKGTKVFSLAGKVKRGGLIEVPMGITIREIVEQIGGGIDSGKAFKAVQIGGPSGGCVPELLADTPIDFEELLNVGAMMGSGGLLVLDESDCMVDISRYFLSFTQNQSCGKCTHCRIGTRHMLNLLEKICAGKGQNADLEKLEELAEQTKRGSLCGLGKTAPNPVISTLKYFREEYEAHLRGVCPAKKCRELITYTINDKCIGCTICAQKCPTDAIPYKPYEMHEIIQPECIKCGTCYQVCPHEAVEIIS